MLPHSCPAMLHCSNIGPSMNALAQLDEAAPLVHAIVPPTPQYCWPLLSRRIGAETWVKPENHTPIGAFKIRGGVLYLDDLRRTQPRIRGIVTATTGNHGQSVAYAATALGLAATIVVPEGNNPAKNRAMRGFGATLVETGHDFQAAYEHAAALAEQEICTSCAPSIRCWCGASPRRHPPYARSPAPRRRASRPASRVRPRRDRSGATGPLVSLAPATCEPGLARTCRARAGTALP